MSAPEALRVVLLDDHDVVLEGLVRLLERDGMTVVGAARHSEECLRLVAESRPELCVVDLRLKDGESALGLIPRLRSAAPKTAIAVLTSFEDGRAAADALRAGANGYIIKDAAGDELCRRLRAIADGDLVVDQRVASAVLNPPEEVLTPQELAVVTLVAQGLTNRQIGERLYLSPHTVKEYLSNGMRRLGTRTRAETVAAAIARGLLDPSRRENSGP